MTGHPPNRRFHLALLLAILLLSITAAQGREVAGITLADSIQTPGGEQLKLNGAGIREKLWIDVYVGSLYLPFTSQDIAQIYSTPGAYRIQLDFVYRKVSKENLIKAWTEGFQNNQDEETLRILADDLQRLYSFFDRDAVSGDRFIFDYSPASGVSIRINNELVGQIKSDAFRHALLDIWLGNQPADKSLKRAMLGLE